MQRKASNTTRTAAIAAGAVSQSPRNTRKNRPTCLHCESRKVRYLSQLRSVTKVKYFCSMRCAGEFGLMVTHHSQYRWCKVHRTWTPPYGVCPACRRNGTDGGGADWNLVIEEAANGKAVANG